jgi:prolyl oligopeptidase
MSTSRRPVTSFNDLGYLRPAKLARALNPPHDTTTDTLHGSIVTDPFRPLEQIDAPGTLEWVARQNGKFDDYIAGNQAISQRTRDYLTPATNYPYETFPYLHGQIQLFSKKDPSDPHPYLRVIRGAGGSESAEDLINPNTIDPSGKTRLCTMSVSEDGRYIAYGLSVSGSDKYGIRVMDTATGRDLPDALPDNYFTGTEWDEEGKGFYYTWMRDDGSRSMDVRYHRLGTDFTEDRTLYSPSGANVFSEISFVRKEDDNTLGDYEFLTESVGTANSNSFGLRRRGSSDAFVMVLDRDSDATLSIFKQYNGKLLAQTDLDAPFGRIVAIDPVNPAPENWTTIVQGTLEKNIGSCFVKKDRLFVNFIVDTADTIEVMTPQGEFMAQVPLPPQSVIGWKRPRYMKDSFHISISGFQEKGGLYEYDIDSNSMTLVKPTSCPVDLRDCIVERAHATSADGTCVPMTIIRHPDTALDGTAATRLYGYGGFNVPLTPGFDANVANWVRQGGIYVQANLRGGGEFGRDWYEAGILDRKQNVFDDMAACAEMLARTGYTSPPRLAIEGGSNGGLLTLATMVQRPELFGAVISDVPVADVLRFHLATNGSNWKSDYGDPDVAADFNVASAYSPVHNVPRGFKHPPCLINTDAHDDRVTPWHAYKMAATLQTREHPACVTLLHTNTDGGHGAGQTTASRIASEAATMAFLEKALGPIDQAAYKAQLASKRVPRMTAGCKDGLKR